MKKTSMGIGRDGGRKFSLPQSGFVDKDEEQVQSKSSKVRVYDKISQPGKISPLDRIATLENIIKNLQPPSMEGVQQNSDMIHQYKLTELSLKKQNEILLQELENSRCLLEKKNQKAEESSVENARIKKQVEELSKKNGELQETHVKILQEKEEQRMEFESLHLDLQVQISTLSASQMFLEEKTNSLQSEMDRRTSVLEKERVLLEGTLMELQTSMDSLNKELESSRAIEEEKQGQIVDLQDQLSSVAAAKMLLEDEMKSLQSEMDRRTLVSEEENVNLKGKLRELEIALDSLNKDLDSSRAMEKERRGQIADLQEQLSSLAAEKMFLEEETKTLQSEMDKRTLVSEEENVNLKGKLREFEIALDSLNKDLESSRAMEKEKEGRIVDLRNHLLDSAKAKTSLEQKNDSLITEMNKCTEENVLLQGKIREFQFDLNCLKNDLEYKDVRLRELTEKVDSHLLENEKLKKDLESKDLRLQELTEKVDSHLLENEKLKKDLESKDLRLQELTEKLDSHLLENGKLKKDLDSKDLRLQELTEKLDSHLLENGKLKKDLESKDLRLQELTEKLDSHLLENGKLKKDLDSKDLRLQELTEKLDSHLLENGKLKKDLESKDLRLQELTEKLDSHLLENGKLKKDLESKDLRLRELTQAKSITEKQTPKQLLKERATPKQAVGKPSPNVEREIPWRY